MKKIIIAVVIIAIGAFWYFYNYSAPASLTPTPPATQTSIAGCYVATLAKDVYTLKVESQTGDNFVGKLSFKNFEKDSSSGTYAGTYKDGILLGDYSFQSEGTYSVIQVVFKKYGHTFIRGFGEMNTTGDRFVDSNNATFDPKQTFVLSTNCPI